MRPPATGGNLADMTTTHSADTTPSPAAPPPVRRLRRSRSDRIGAGVAGSLGEYFGVDPVLFRVLFATAAFFGGAGALGYLLAWAAIPEAGTERAPVDGWVAALRKRRIPFWVLVTAGSLLFWIVAFSWWAPGPFIPVVAVVILLVAIFGRRGQRGGDETVVEPAGNAETVSLRKGDAGQGRPDLARDTRGWLRESRAASRARARRAFPVKITTLLLLMAALVTLALIDAGHGIVVPLYFWFALAILAAGLLTGIALRRTPWSIASLLVPTIAGLIAFAGTHVSVHDGIGQREWTPTSELSSQYRLAFGKATLDLRSLKTQDAPRLVHVEQAAGQLRIIAPESLNLTVSANVHFGVVTLDGEQPEDGDGGMTVRRIVEPFPNAVGGPITIDVHLADGNVDIVRS